MNYTSLEQRMIHAYIEMFPPLVPLKDGPVPVQAQEQFYLFMKDLYKTIFDLPELFFKKINEDDAFPNRFNRASYGKPKLQINMKKDQNEIDELIAWLFSVGRNSNVENGKLILSEVVQIKKKYLNVLPQFGLKLHDHVLSCAKFDNLFPAWKWMATRENATVISFSQCMFDPDFFYMQEIYSTLFGDEKAGQHVSAISEKEWLSMR
jgi:hypothetical protein